MVARCAQEGLDVSRSAVVVSRLPRAAYECAPAASDRSPGSRACRHHQARRRSYAASQLCHPSLGAKDRYSDQPARRLAEDARLTRPLSPPSVEVADIFRHRGPAWRASHAGHVSLDQLKVMSALERCRTWAFSPRARPVGLWAGMSNAARPAPTCASLTTLAATGIAR